MMNGQGQLEPRCKQRENTVLWKGKSQNQRHLRNWKAVQSMLIAWLLNTIESSLRSTLFYYDDAESLWTHLKLRFCIVNGACICQLKASLGDCKQGKGEEVSAYFIA